MASHSPCNQKAKLWWQWGACEIVLQQMEWIFFKEGLITSKILKP
jgi:hypothetical protein